MDSRDEDARGGRIGNRQNKGTSKCRSQQDQLPYQGRCTASESSADLSERVGAAPQQALQKL